MPYYCLYSPLPGKIMKTEKILLSFVAIIVGLIVAGIGFYVYQSTKVIPNTKLGSVKLATPTPSLPTVLLVIDNPQDESTTDNKTVTISGKTVPGATVLVSTPTGDQVVKPSSEGNFTTSATISDGENIIHVTAIDSTGNQTEKVLTVTFTTESF